MSGSNSNKRHAGDEDGKSELPPPMAPQDEREYGRVSTTIFHLLG